MQLRAPLRWVSGALVFIGAALVTANLDRLAGALGWDTFLSDAVADGVPSIFTSPVAALVGVAAISFAAGFWLDWLLARPDRTRPSHDQQLSRLGLDALNLAVLAGHHRDHPLEDHTAVFAQVLSIMLRFEKEGIMPPLVDNLSNQRKLSVATHFLHLMGNLLKDGHYEEAVREGLEYKVPRE